APVLLARLVTGRSHEFHGPGSRPDPGVFLARATHTAHLDTRFYAPAVGAAVSLAMQTRIFSSSLVAFETTGTHQKGTGCRMTAPAYKMVNLTTFYCSPGEAGHHPACGATRFSRYFNNLDEFP